MQARIIAGASCDALPKVEKVEEGTLLLDEKGFSQDHDGDHVAAV